MEEVRYQMLRPAQIVARRTQCAIAYVPLGILEWHGQHNPLGADALQAEGIAIHAAQHGGLVMPTLYWGEPKVECIEYIPQHRAGICREMQLPEQNFTPERLPMPHAQSVLFYQQLLLNMLYQLDSLGFKVGVLIAGHYPLIAHANIAAEQYNTLHWIGERRDYMVPWACLEPTVIRVAGYVGSAGDHGGKWETSNLLALHPNSVDLRVCKPEGVVGAMPEPHVATAEQGHRQIAMASDVIAKESRHRLDVPGWYRHPSDLMNVGKWKE